ncbi:MAG: hypothetical protein ACE5FT_03470 [Candidatus Nanoarchaeia archaeon]
MSKPKYLASLALTAVATLNCNSAEASPLEAISKEAISKESADKERTDKLYAASVAKLSLLVDNGEKTIHQWVNDDIGAKDYPSNTVPLQREYFI